MFLVLSMAMTHQFKRISSSAASSSAASALLRETLKTATVKHFKQRNSTATIKAKDFHLKLKVENTLAVDHQIEDTSNKTTTTTKKKKVVSSGAFYEGIRQNQLKYSPHLLMARVGDFYEFYFEDAFEVSKNLNLKLAKTQYQGDAVYFCGFPSFKMKDYLKLLLDKGYSVAKYEQYERELASSEEDRVIVRRVDRIYTQGTLTEEELVEENTVRNIMAICPGGNSLESKDNHRNNLLGFSLIDLSSGNFYYGKCSPSQMKHVISSISPIEILTTEEFVAEVKNEDEKLWTELNDEFQFKVDRKLFFTNSGFEYLNELKVSTDFKQSPRKRVTKDYSLESNSLYEPQDVAASALLDYIADAHDGLLPLVDYPTLYKEDIVQIDPETRRSLELVSRMRGSSTAKKGSLFELMNKTVTPLGTKELSTRLSAPLKSLSLLNSYLDIVSAVKESDKLQGNLHDLLSSYFLHDVGRAMQNLKLSHGGPWHLGVIYRHLLGYTKIRSSIPNGFTQLLERASLFEDSLNSPLVDELLELLAHVLPKEFIKEEMPLSLLPKNIQEPGFISPACHPQLKQAAASYDKKIAMKDNLETELKQVLSKYSISCSSLEYKKQLGAFIELEGTKDNFDKLESDHSEFLHLQTLRGQGRTIRKRFRHSKWMDLHQSILAYHDSYFQAEKQAFQFVCGEIYGHKRLILQIARLIAHLDVNLCFAKLAKENKYCRPTLTDEPVLSVEKGRHPVVEKSLMDEMKSFVPNSCYLSASKKDPQIVVLTGSNMGGKSTYLRQNALISIMAHMGSYVPAAEATIGIADKIFSRLGTSDDVGRHQSSFMVEMMETAFILNQCSPKSLVFMDEVGRGTSFNDGSAIAYGVLKCLKKKGPRTIFATHYEEVANEMNMMDNVKCSKMIIRRDEMGFPIFAYGVEDGVCSEVYGLYVAQLAGVPLNVIKEAENWKKTTSGGLGEFNGSR